MTAREFEQKMERFPRFIAVPIIVLRYAVLIGAVAIMSLAVAATLLLSSPKQPKLIEATATDPEREASPSGAEFRHQS